MKAITTMKLHRNAGKNRSVKDASGNVNGASFRLAAEAKFSCPITGTDFNGRAKFVVLVPSGVVVSERALREAKSTVEELLLEEAGGLEGQTRLQVNPKAGGLL
jgi:hypothetical protein